MKTLKKVLPLLLTGALLLTTTAPVLAVGSSSEKEEVIYVNTAADGTVKDIYAVNIFGSGDITDYGDYSSVQVLNTTDPISVDGDLVTFSSSADRVYYEGKMKDTVIPWNISIRYFLNGKELTGEDIAGKSGSLNIRFQVTKNESCPGTFFDNYALQASFSLDTKSCRNIVAPDATLANAGSKKQISYTLLPGEGIHTVITADVTDFEMDAVSINGIPLSMNIEVDEKELTDQVQKLQDAVTELDNGSSDLKDGVALLEKGMTKLTNKSDTLTDGSKEIKKALTQIQKKLSSVSASTKEIDALVAGSSAIKTGIASLSKGVANLQNNVSFAAYKTIMQQKGLDIDQLQSANTQTIESLSGQIAALNQNIRDLEQAGMDTTELRATVSQLQSIVTLLQGNNAAIGGTNSYLTQVHTNIGTLAAGATSLKENYAKLDKGINTLATETSTLMTNLTALKKAINTLVKKYSKLDKGVNSYTDGVAELSSGVKTLSDGTNKLKNGTEKLRKETDGMDTEISDKVDDMIEGITGGDGEISSFVSEKNRNVKSVQFVIQTESVKPAETEVIAPAPEKELTFWQKLLKLFGLYD